MTPKLITIGFSHHCQKPRLLALCLVTALGACDCSDGTVKPPGSDYTRWDPIAHLDAIAAFAGPGAVLAEYDLRFVRPDGTLDLTTQTYHAEARYDFRVPATSDPSKPIGAGGFAGPGSRSVNVEVSQPGTWHHVTGTRTYDYKDEGMKKSVADAHAGAVEAIARPACSPATLWKTAIANGAPANAVANIEWDGDYEFRIGGTDVRFDFDAQCAVKK